MVRKRHLVRVTFLGLMAAGLILLGIMPIDAGADQRKGLKTVEVTGSSPISDSGPAAAREKAVASCLDAAVNQVVADEIPADTLAASPEAVTAALSGKTQSFIENYKVLEASETEEGYQVVVEVTVSVPGIKKELSRTGILPVAKTPPRVLFLTSQQNLDDVVPQYWWSGSDQEPDLVAENTMIEVLKEKGFFIISNQDSMLRAAAASHRYTPNLDNQQAVDLGARIGADMVVVGQTAAQATPREEGKTLRFFKATSSLRAVTVDSAVQLASASEEFVAQGSDDPAGGRNALAGAGAAAGKTLAARLYSAWLTHEKAASFVRLEVEGTHALADFVRFREALKKTHGANEVRIEVLRRDSSVIAIGFDGNAEALARILMATGYESFGIKINQITRNGIGLQLIKNTGATASQ